MTPDRLHILRRHRAYFVALRAQCLVEEMRTWTGFHPDQIDLEVRSEPKNRKRGKFPSGEPVIVRISMTA